MKSAFLVAIAGTFMTGIAHSSPPCENASSQASLNECATQSMHRADAELNRLYQALTKSLKDDPEAERKLVAAQREWIKFRDSECSFQALKSEGGSANAMVLSMCVEDHTRTRMRSLRGYLECKEGELYCGPLDQ